MSIEFALKLNVARGNWEEIKEKDQDQDFDYTQIKKYDINTMYKYSAEIQTKFRELEKRLLIKYQSHLSQREKRDMIGVRFNIAEERHKEFEI